MQWLVVLPLEIVAASITLDFWPGARDTNPAAWVTIFLVVIVAINFFGVRGYGEAEFVFAIIKVIAVIGFIILGIILVSQKYFSRIGVVQITNFRYRTAEVVQMVDISAVGIGRATTWNQITRDTLREEYLLGQLHQEHSTPGSKVFVVCLSQPRFPSLVPNWLVLPPQRPTTPAKPFQELSSKCFGALHCFTSWL